MADENVHDLLAYRFNGKYYAEDGERGGSNQCFGRKGKDVVLKVPCGTLVRDAESGKIICDAYENGEKILLLAGGRGRQGQRPFHDGAPPCAQLCAKGRQAASAYRHSRDEGHRRRGAGRIPQRGKSTLLSKISARAAQDCGLSLHHALAQPGGREVLRQIPLSLPTFRDSSRARRRARDWDMTSCATSSVPA